MIKPFCHTLLLAIAAPSLVAHAGVYSFGGSCPTQGAWTQMAIQQSGLIADAVRQLRDNPACKGIESVVSGLQKAQEVLATSPDQQKEEDRMESLPAEMTALRNGVMTGGQVNDKAASLLLNRTMEAAAISSKIDQNSSLKVADFTPRPRGLTSIFSKLAGPASKGLDLATQVMELLPQYDECLIGHPQQGLSILAGAVKVAAAFSAAGEGVGDKLGNAINGLATMVRNRRFTQVLRKLDESEFWFSISCLVESTSKNYCDAQNAQEILQYSKAQYTNAMKRNTDGRKDPSYDNPLEGYYLMVRELPLISAWMQQVQFGTNPRLLNDADFKNKVWDQVNDLTKAINNLNGDLNEQLLFMRELTDTNAKKNQLSIIIGRIVQMMAAGESAKFFNTTVNADLLPFYLIGRNKVPPECVQSKDVLAKQEWGDFMRRSNGGDFIREFDDPEKLALVVQSKVQDIILGASQKSSAYFRKRLVMDNQNLVNQTLTGQYMTVRKAFENVFNYLVRFETRLKKDNGNLDLTLVSTVRETRAKIKKFLDSYNDLRDLGAKIVNSTTVGDNDILISQSNKAANKVIDTLFDEFNLLYQKDTFLTNRLSTFIEHDFSNRIRNGDNMTPYQQDILTITQKHLLDKLIEVHGINPTNAQMDLANAQVVNKRNLEAVEELFSDSMYRMILDVKSVADGKDENAVQDQLRKKFEKEKQSTRKFMAFMPSPTMPLGSNLIGWLFAGTAVRNAHPDLYKNHTNTRAIKGVDDKFGSFSQVQAKFCAQTLAFENRGFFRDICQGTSIKSYYSTNETKTQLDLRYDDYLPPGSNNNVIRKNGVQTSNNICAYNNFQMKNLVQWLKDQDAEIYDDQALR